MKASIINDFGTPSVFEYTEEAPIPEIGPNQVLIKVRAASVNPIDYKTRNGSLRWILGRKFPKVLGYDVAGVIHAIGSEVKDWQIGERVCARLDDRYGGAYAEFAACGARVLACIPDKIADSTAAAIPLAGLTAFQGLQDFKKVGKGDRVLILGATGGVGSFAVQIAELLGADVTAVCSKASSEFLATYYSGRWLDYTSSDFYRKLEKYDLIFDTVGGYPYPRMRKFVQPRGTWVTTLPRIPVLVYKIFAKLFGHEANFFLMRSRAREVTQLLNWVDKGQIKVLIDSSYPLNSLMHAHERIETGRTRGKIIIEIM